MVAIASPSTDRAAVAKLISRLTGETITPDQTSELLVFTGALSAVLIGVTYADREVSNAEKSRLQTTLNEFVPKTSQLRPLFEVMFKGVKQVKLHQKPQALAILLNALDESAKLLLLASGYELATADGAIDPTEDAYLQQVTQDAGLAVVFAETLRDGLTEAATIDGDALAEIKRLLDPARFQSLDPVFSRAAARMLDHLPREAKSRSTKQQAIRYDHLEQFQAKRQQLKAICTELEAVLADSQAELSLPNSLTEDLAKIQAKLDSQKFRVAIVGEFSQGKSTLLNALLGEEIQPVRAIPCSGTVTVLRHGDRRRVIAKYRDGREEEIPFEQYQEKASISEDAALSNRDDALNSDLLELILEHPELELCRQGVELIDSPGLNDRVIASKNRVI